MKHPNGLRSLMKRDSIKQADIARVWGVENADAFQRVNGSVRITPDRAKMLTKAFGWSIAEIYGEVEKEATIPVLGYVGAGAVVFPYDDHAKGAGLEEVECPVGYSAHNIVALRVTGDSMDPAIEDGDLIFYRRDRDGVPPECLGKKCVVKLDNDGVLVKRLTKGSKPGLYHLLSINKRTDPIIDAKIVWAARVIDIRPG